MANWNITVMERGVKVVDGVKVLENKSTQIFTRQCFTVQEANELRKAKLEEYPDRSLHMIERAYY